MPRTKKPTTQEKPQFSIHTVSLTAEETRALQLLSQSASDFFGRSVSGSAVIRAMLRLVTKHDSWATDTLLLEIERELNAGVRWGKQG